MPRANNTQRKHMTPKRSSPVNGRNLARSSDDGRFVDVLFEGLFLVTLATTTGTLVLLIGT